MEISAPGSIHSRSSASLPELMRETSRMSLMMRACVLALRLMASRLLANSSGGDLRSRWCTFIMIALKGLRSSCDSTATKSSLERL
ncbi:hypothetical protein D3C71_1888760 [compost metagenome]